MSYLYGVHGLVLRSASPFPELLPAKGEADVYMHPGELAHPAARDFTDGRYAVIDEDGVTVAWHTYATFRISGGRLLEYAADAEGRKEPTWVRQTLLGAGLGLLLHQRGRLVLHANALRVNGGAVLLLGRKRQGKSTTAAALCHRGHLLVADDVVTVSFQDGIPLIQPGLAQVKLWSDAASSLNLNGAGTRLHSNLDKFVYPLPGISEPLPLKAAVLLGGGDENRIVEIESERDAFFALFPHLYAPRLLGPQAVTATLHQSLAQFSSKATVYQIHREQGLRHLPEILDLIVQVAL